MKAIADENSENCCKQLIPHTGGTKSFARYAKELTVDGCPPNRIEMFRHMHTTNGGKGKPINGKAKAILCRRVLHASYGSGAAWPCAWPWASLTPTPVFGPSSSKMSHETYSQVCNQLKSVLSEMELMKATMSQQIQEEKEKCEETERRVEQMQEQMQQFMQNFQHYIPSNH